MNPKKIIGTVLSAARKLFVHLTGMFSIVNAQSIDPEASLPQKASDTFVHHDAAPIFLPKSVRSTETRHEVVIGLSDFPEVHVQQLKLQIVLDKPFVPGALVDVMVSEWQPFPNQVEVQVQVTESVVQIHLKAPMGCNLRPGDLVKLNWGLGTGLNPAGSKLLRIDGIVITDNIDSFRQWWWPPITWLRKLAH